jgi:hypothetical protein
MQVMDVGPSIKIPCVHEFPNPNGTFKYPDIWGGRTMQCREPKPCVGDPLTPPINAGLQVDPATATAVVNEWEAVNYTCKDSNLFVYLNGERVRRNL